MQAEFDFEQELFPFMWEQAMEKEKSVEVFLERPAFTQLMRLRALWGKFTQAHKERIVKFIHSRAMYKQRGKYVSFGLGEHSDDLAFGEVAALFASLEDRDQLEVAKQADLYEVRRAS